MSDEDRFEQIIEKLLAGQSPRLEVTSLSDEGQHMIRMAQLLHGSRGQEMAPAFAERLHARLFPRRRISRRTAFLSGLGALVAGILASIGLDGAIRNSPPTQQEQLVGLNGHWYLVAHLADLPEGTIRPFTAGAVQGFLMYHLGQYQAFSSLCTHMGCTLRINRAAQTFECPCHGAVFDRNGHLTHGSREYGWSLPSLPPIMTRVKGESVEAFGV